MARARRNWTTEEDAALRRAVNTDLVQSRPLLWRELAKSVPGRSNKDCRRRWWNSLAAGTAKGPWSEEEDERLIEAVRKYGFSWSRVAQAVMSRNPDQCSSHWSQVLDPSINHCDWTPTEDTQLLHAVLTHGTNWATIASSHVPKRTTLALKNRYSTLRLWNENSSKKSKQQAATGTPDTSSIGSLGTITVMTSPQSEVRKSPDVQSYGNDKTAEGDEGEEEDDEDEDEDESIESGYSGYEDEDDGKASGGQYIGTPNSPSQRRDLKLTTPGTQAHFVEQGGGGILFPTNSFYYGRAPTLPTPTPTPKETWTPEAADHLSSYKNPFASANHQSPPLGIPRDYSNFFGAIQDPAATPTNVPYPPYHVDALDMDPSPVSASSYAPMPQPAALLTGEMSTTTSSPVPCISKSPKAHDNTSTTYQVTLDLVCTGAQIEAVMSVLEGVGTSVTMKIEPRPSSSSGPTNRQGSGVLWPGEVISTLGRL